MIFLGDIASPDTGTSQDLERFFVENTSIFDRKRLICNFEGLISGRKALNDNLPLLYNHISVPEVLNRGVSPVLCLANNHILDLPDAFDETINTFKENSVFFCGAGKSHKNASAPISFYEAGRHIILFNACWDFLVYNHPNPSQGLYVAEINEAGLIAEVKNQKEAHNDAAIVIFLHWSLDLETLPFPMYRQFSRDLIDAGAAIVAGSHSHCVQGGEKYKDGLIVYGLGNFFMPHNVFISGKLVYPEFSRIQLAVEWCPSTKNATCHWFEYIKNGASNDLKYLGSDKFEESERLNRYSPFRGMSDGEYLTWFRKNRRKRFLIPVYTDYKRKYTNMLFTHILKDRARIAHFLARLNLIKWQN